MSEAKKPPRLSDWLLVSSQGEVVSEDADSESSESSIEVVYAEGDNVHSNSSKEKESEGQGAEAVIVSELTQVPPTDAPDAASMPRALDSDQLSTQPLTQSCPLVEEVDVEALVEAIEGESPSNKDSDGTDVLATQDKASGIAEPSSQSDENVIGDIASHSKRNESASSPQLEDGCDEVPASVSGHEECLPSTTVGVTEEGKEQTAKEELPLLAENSEEASDNVHGDDLKEEQEKAAPVDSSQAASSVVDAVESEVPAVTLPATDRGQDQGACCSELLKEGSDTDESSASVVSLADLDGSAGPGKSDSDADSDFIRLDHENAVPNMFAAEPESPDQETVPLRIFRTSSSIDASFNFMRAGSHPPYHHEDDDRRFGREEEVDDEDTESSTEESIYDRIESEQSEAGSLPPQSDVGDLSMFADIGDLPLVQGNVARNYIHQPNNHLSTILNITVVLAAILTTGISLGIIMATDLEIEEWQNAYELQVKKADLLKMKLVETEVLLQQYKEKANNFEDVLSAYSHYESIGENAVANFMNQVHFAVREYASCRQEWGVHSTVTCKSEVAPYILTSMHSLKEAVTRERERLLVETTYPVDDGVMEEGENVSWSYKEERSDGDIPKLVAGSEPVFSEDEEEENTNTFRATMKMETVASSSVSERTDSPKPAVDDGFDNLKTENDAEIKEENTEDEEDIEVILWGYPSGVKRRDYGDGLDYANFKNGEEYTEYDEDMEEKEDNPTDVEQPETKDSEMNHGTGMEAGTVKASPVPLDIHQLQRSLTLEQERALHWQQLYLAERRQRERDRDNEEWEDERDRDRWEQEKEHLDSLECLRKLMATNVTTLTQHVIRWNVSVFDDFANLSMLMSSVTELKKTVVESVLRAWEGAEEVIRSMGGGEGMGGGEQSQSYLSDKELVIGYFKKVLGDLKHGVEDVLHEVNGDESESFPSESESFPSESESFHSESESFHSESEQKVNSFSAKEEEDDDEEGRGKQENEGISPEVKGLKRGKWAKHISKWFKKTSSSIRKFGRRLGKTWHKVKTFWYDKKPKIFKMANDLRDAVAQMSSSVKEDAPTAFVKKWSKGGSCDGKGLSIYSREARENRQALQMKVLLNLCDKMDKYSEECNRAQKEMEASLNQMTGDLNSLLEVLARKQTSDQDAVKGKQEVGNFLELWGQSPFLPDSDKTWLLCHVRQQEVLMETGMPRAVSPEKSTRRARNDDDDDDEDSADASYRKEDQKTISTDRYHVEFEKELKSLPHQNFKPVYHKQVVERTENATRSVNAGITKDERRKNYRNSDWYLERGRYRLQLRKGRGKPDRLPDQAVHRMEKGKEALDCGVGKAENCRSSEEWLLSLGEERQRQREDERKADWLFERAKDRRNSHNQKWKGKNRKCAGGRGRACKDEIRGKRSGDWYLEQGKEREKQRKEDHKADWLFDRSAGWRGQEEKHPTFHRQNQRFQKKHNRLREKAENMWKSRQKEHHGRHYRHAYGKVYTP